MFLGGSWISHPKMRWSLNSGLVTPLTPEADSKHSLLLGDQESRLILEPSFFPLIGFLGKLPPTWTGITWVCHLTNKS